MHSYSAEKGLPKARSPRLKVPKLNLIDPVCLIPRRKPTCVDKEELYLKILKLKEEFTRSLSGVDDLTNIEKKYKEVIEAIEDYLRFEQFRPTAEVKDKRLLTVEEMYKEIFEVFLWFIYRIRPETLFEDESESPSCAAAQPSLFGRMLSTDEDYMAFRKQLKRPRDTLPCCFKIEGSLLCKDAKRRHIDEIEAARSFFTHDSLMPKTLRRLNEARFLYRHTENDCGSNLMAKQPKRILPNGAKKEMYKILMREVFAKNDFCMCVPEQVILNILREGRFKSQHETSGRNIGRKKAALNMFGVSKKSSPEEDMGEEPLDIREYEKYGYASSRNFKTKLQDIAITYGRIFVILKKERLMDRTTFTLGDSLRFALLNTVIASRVADVKTTAIPLEVTGGEARALFNFEKLKEAFNLTDDPGKLAKTVAEAPYIELQFHGELTTDDIEHILISRSFMEGINGKITAEMCRLKNIPFAVYSDPI